MSDSTYHKIKTLHDLADELGRVKGRGSRVVQCHGVFDLLHPGHIKHFEAAKRLGDVLVVTVTKDEYVNKGPGRPVFNQRLRAQSIAALQCVDFVAVNDWPSAVEAIRLLRPDVYVKGSEYADSSNDLSGRINDEAEAVASVGGYLRFTDEQTYSSTGLLNSLFSVYPEQADRFLQEFRRRHRPDELINRLKALRRLRVLVLGETIIDEYDYCAPLAKSPKDTFIVAKYLERERFAGGVLAVANHVAGFCESVDLLTTIGRDGCSREFVLANLKPNVRATVLVDDNQRTIVKRRFVEPSFMKKLFEISFLDDKSMAPEVEARLFEQLNPRLPDYDLVVLADFGHGFVTPALADVLSTRAPYLAVNAQTNSQNIGFNLITKYKRADYVCVDEPELRLAMGERSRPLAELVSSIAQRLECSKVSVTRGASGTVTYSREDGYFDIPVFSNRVVDTVGAGDAYLAVTALCAADGMPADVLAFVGNAVGALAVQIVGNRAAIDPVALYKSVSALLH